VVCPRILLGDADALLVAFCLLIFPELVHLTGKRETKRAASSAYLCPRVLFRGEFRFKCVGFRSRRYTKGFSQ
jgi:hypothetical protein